MKKREGRDTTSVIDFMKSQKDGHLSEDIRLVMGASAVAQFLLTRTELDQRQLVNFDREFK